MNNEEFYDQEIAPKLLALCKACQDRSMAFVACVEYDPPNHGIARTEFQPPDEKDRLSSSQRLVHWAARSNGNVDKLIGAIDRHGKEHGHSSVYLQMLHNNNVKYDGPQPAFAISVFANGR